jgi:hypothetical protein
VSLFRTTCVSKISAPSLPGSDSPQATAAIQRTGRPCG